ncbi:serine-rich adhesin for platelets isoform X2 [Manihot esculenta]|uniref:serine-rich adhesin for platelets isoform X2 n=1 Tax=Manihot esculenta TaxID=3983 RepID=UPI000B5D5D1D|nr:serine-rich adhesin for platelets isoform X2 [Manihot esculenta]
MKTIMEAKRIRRSSSRKPLSDCTNSIHSIKPSLSSSTSTKNSSSHIKSSKFLPANSETTEQSETQAKSTSGSTATGQIGNHSLKSSNISLTVASTPSRDSKPSSLAGTASHEVSEPCSVYSRRESIDKRKSKGKAVAVPMSCFSSVKNQFTRDEMNEGRTTRLSKSCTVPYKKLSCILSSFNLANLHDVTAEKTSDYPQGRCCKSWPDTGFY